MSAPRTIALLVIVLLVSLLSVSDAGAQAFTAPLVLEIQSAAPLPAPAWTSPQAQSELLEFEAYKRQRRARFILTAGLGLLTGSVIHVAAVAPNRQCSSAPDAPTLKSSLYGAGVLGGIGLGLAIGGGTTLGMSARRDGWRKPSAGQRWLAAGAGLIGAGLATALLIPVWGIDSVKCSS